MTDFVRVKNAMGDEFSWPTELVEGVEGVEVVDKATHGPDGELIPPKYHTTVSQSAAAKKKSGHQADAAKETD